MKDNASALEANLSYAVSMVRWSFFTPNHAARTCGIPLPTLKAALGVSAERVPAPGQEQSAPDVAHRHTHNTTFHFCDGVPGH